MPFLERILRKSPFGKQDTFEFNLSDVLSDFSDKNQINIRFVHSLALLPKPKIAFHKSDADGIVSAVILKILGGKFKNSVFIPLEYQEIRHPKFGYFLKKINWIAIVDLPPFNESKISLYADHHLTNKKMNKQASVILFDENSPSTALLLADHYNKKIPKYLHLLSDLTSITDTANYSTEPPTKTPSSFPRTREDQAWLLDDLCRTPESAEDSLKLVQDLSREEIGIFENIMYRQRISKIRTFRKKSMELGESFDIEDVILIVRGKEKIMTSALVHKLFVRGAKITCVLFPGKQFTGISLRVNPQIPDSELETYRVDFLATDLSGGGHPRAAGGRGFSLKRTLNELVTWAQVKQFTYQIYDLRKNLNKYVQTNEI
ncbi:MAG: bifunctional oligoribonuclease/PAP phosphatase NrnA [Candidatus Hodarchaeota archaeon]